MINFSESKNSLTSSRQQEPNLPPRNDFFADVFANIYIKTGYRVDPLAEKQAKKEFEYLLKDGRGMFLYPKYIIAGYLNIKSSDGWEEGGDRRIGASFTRYILVRHYVDGKYTAEFEQPVLEKVINCFSDIGDYKNDYAFNDCSPENSRICYDPGIKGWQDHTVCRMIGNLGSQYHPSKPFFEIIINAQQRNGNSVCNPFFITIYRNEKELNERRKELSNFRKSDLNSASSCFYASSLKKPSDYLEGKIVELGPNSTRLLKGLQFLEKKQMQAQESGNCWIKQPMRCLLVGLFIEHYTNTQDVPPDKAWIKAQEAYKTIHKSVGIPVVEHFLRDVKVTKQMKESALNAIEKQKQI